MGRRPVVFVSSTFYDLKHLRSELSTFIDEMGYEPRLSEHHSFPIDPDRSTIDSCRKAASEADMLVLVVGGRYGSVVVDVDKSVTNIEYLTAVSNGIPTFAFVEAGILDVLPVWRKNQGGDFTETVDSPRLFEFVESFYGGGQRWVFPFRTPQDIKDALTGQWAHLLQDGLQLRRRMSVPGLPQSVKHLSGEALRIVIERPDRWEFLFFGELLTAAFAGTSDLERDVLYRLSDAPPEVTLEPAVAFQWVRSQFSLMLAYAREMTILVNRTTLESFGPDGQPGDADAIVYTSDRFMSVYRQALISALDCYRRVLPEEAALATAILGKNWEQQAKDMRKQLLELAALALRVGRKETNEFAFKFTLEEADMSGWDEAMESLRPLVE